MTTKTSFGIVTRDETGTTVYGSNLTGGGNNPHTLREWSTIVGWPLSGLARVDDLAVRFDNKGDLVDYNVSNPEAAPIYADELNAWTSECLIRAGYPNHPAIRSEFSHFGRTVT